MFEEKNKRHWSGSVRRSFLIYAAVICVLHLGMTVYATSDPVGIINNLSSIIFSIVKAIGGILVGFGVVQVGLSLKSHDASQRANGFLTVAGGIVIYCSEYILNFITGQ